MCVQHIIDKSQAEKAALQQASECETMPSGHRSQDEEQIFEEQLGGYTPCVDEKQEFRVPGMTIRHENREVWIWSCQVLRMFGMPGNAEFNPNPK